MEVVRNLIYADNTTVIVLNTKVKTTGDMEEVTVDGEMVDVVIIFISLGALIISDGLCDKEIRRGIAMGKDSSFSSRFLLVVWVAAADRILLKQVLSLISSYVVPMVLSLG